MTPRGRRPAPPLALLLAAGLAVGASACSNDGGTSIGSGSTTTLAFGGAGGGSSATPAASSARTVDTCASLTAADLTALGVEELQVTAVQDVSDVLQGLAQGGTGCLFSLTRDGAGSASLTVLAHPDGGAYFDSTVGRLADAQPIPGLGDDARSGSTGPGTTTVITRRGPLVVEARIGRPDILDPNLLIAVAGLALEREDQP